MTARSSDRITIAHLTDVHLELPPGFAREHWNVKRGLGYLNWTRSRRAVHRRDVLDAICADMATSRPDHIAVSGDLINIGLPAEYEAAHAWLERLGSPDRVSVVPGNHDIYVRLRDDPGVARWKVYMGGATGAGDAAFPYFKQLGPVALIGVNSAHPTPPFVAAGRSGTRQRARLATLIDEARAGGSLAMVMIHHPPLDGQAPRLRALADAAAMERLLVGHGADVVLHGHNHRHMRAVRQRPDGGQLNVLGLPSASAAISIGHDHLAAYQRITVARRAQGFRIEVTVRGFAEPGGPIAALEHWTWDISEGRRYE